MSRAIARIITINGQEIPAPDEGFEIIESTLVDGARNANGITVGQQINTIWKINNLQWSTLTTDEWVHVQNCIASFYCRVRFVDNYNREHTCIMYPGDRNCKPSRVTTNLTYESFKNCKFNLIDTGKKV